MKLIRILFFCFPLLYFGQKKKNIMDVVSNADAKAIIMKPLGNNTFAKDLQTFYGFGFGGNLMTPIRFGIGLDYSILFSNVKYGRENYFGSIGSPTMHVFDAFLTHRENISEDFFVEEMLGYSYFALSTPYIYNSSNFFKTTGSGPLLGGKAIYNLDREGRQQAFGNLKFNMYFNTVYNEDPSIQNYYSRSFFLSFGLGYRYNS